MNWLRRRGIFALVAIAATASGEVAAAAEPRFEASTTKHFVLEWPPSLSEFGRALQISAETHYSHVYEALDFSVPETGQIRVTIVEDAPTMIDLARREQGRLPPEWAAGLAYPLARRIYLHAARPAAEVELTFRHEVAHIAIGELVAREIPRWFHEGTAIALSEPLSFERMRVMTEAALVDGLLRFDEITTGFPASGARANVAYAQSAHFVGYLQTAHGPHVFSQLIEQLRSREDASFRTVLDEVYPKTFPALERDWRAQVRVRWGWVPVIFGSSTLWIGASLLLVMAWRRRRRQREERIQEMVGREAVDTADDIEIVHDLRPPQNMHDPYEGRPPTIH